MDALGHELHTQSPVNPTEATCRTKYSLLYALRLTGIFLCGHSPRSRRYFAAISPLGPGPIASFLSSTLTFLSSKLTFLGSTLTFLSSTLTFLSSQLTFLSSKLTFLSSKLSARAHLPQSPRCGCRALRWAVARPRWRWIPKLHTRPAPPCKVHHTYTIRCREASLGASTYRNSSL
jgi:hypothetical protein